MMNFASPNWAYLLFLLPALALVKIWADARAQKAMESFAASERLRSSLLGGASLIWSGLHFGLQLLGLGFFIIALTRPQIGMQELEAEQSGRNIFITIDTSKSMLADDVPPSRLTRAKLAAQDLLEKLPGDRVGLIAFAGRSFLQAPLTTDHEAVIESIQSLDHTTIPRGGSSLAAAIELALQTVAKMPGKQHGMIIFTDGQETDDAMMSLAQTAAEKRLLVLPVGVGTREGAPIPDPDPQNSGGFLRDDNGSLIHSRLESEALQELANASGGQYTELNTQTLSAEIVNRLLASLDRHRDASKQVSRPIERYQWPLFFGIMCLAMSLFMKPSSRRLVRVPALPVDPQTTVHHPPPATALATLVVFGLLVGMGHAASVTEAEQAQQAYLDGRYEAARNTYRELSTAKEKKLPAPAEELAYGLGAATFQLKEYDRAARAFSDALRSGRTDVKRQAQRSLATSLYNQGDLLLSKQPELTIKAWTDSRDHFTSALQITPEGTTEFEQIRENRDFVQKRLDELKEQQAQQQQQQNQQQQKGKGKGQGNPDQQPQDGDQQQNSGEQEQQEQNKGDEKKTDAMQKDQGQLPEGELRAGEAGKPANEPSQGKEPDDKRNDKTGFTPQEARSQLRNYADDQKSVQYLMRKEEPEGGKDY